MSDSVQFVRTNKVRPEEKDPFFISGLGVRCCHTFDERERQINGYRSMISSVINGDGSLQSSMAGIH